jgi:hypothetical protein
MTGFAVSVDALWIRIQAIRAHSSSAIWIVITGNKTKSTSSVAFAGR